MFLLPVPFPVSFSLLCLLYLEFTVPVPFICLMFLFLFHVCSCLQPYYVPISGSFLFPKQFLNTI